MTAPAISVLVCTHDRPALLEAALRGLLAQTLPPERFEVVVVDNGPRSGLTRAALASITDPGAARFVCVDEPRLGLSRARNTGLRAARGAYVAFLDDDAVPAPDWVEHMLAALVAHAPRVGVVAGRVLPRYEAPRPPWLPDELVGYLSVVDWAPEPRALGPEEWAVGANVGYVRERVLAVGGFPEAVGRVGATLLSMEETVLHRALAARGWEARWEPRALVHHLVPAERLRLPWLLRRAFWQGASHGILARASGRDPAATIWPVWTWSKVASIALPLVLAPWQLRGLVDPTRAREGCRSMHRAGYLAGLTGLVGAPRTP